MYIFDCFCYFDKTANDKAESIMEFQNIENLHFYFLGLFFNSIDFSNKHLNQISFMTDWSYLN